MVFAKEKTYSFFPNVHIIMDKLSNGRLLTGESTSYAKRIIEDRKGLYNGPDDHTFITPTKGPCFLVKGISCRS